MDAPIDGKYGKGFGESTAGQGVPLDEVHKPLFRKLAVIESRQLRKQQSARLPCGTVANQFSDGFSTWSMTR
jgi:hypothetical protein